MRKEKSARHWLRKLVKGKYGRHEDVLSEAEEDKAEEDFQKEGNNILEKKGAWALVALGGEGKEPAEEILGAKGMEKLEAKEGLENCETFHSPMVYGKKFK